jgi:hypothetical protein
VYQDFSQLGRQAVNNRLVNDNGKRLVEGADSQHPEETGTNNPARKRTRMRTRMSAAPTPAT